MSEGKIKGLKSYPLAESHVHKAVVAEVVEMFSFFGDEAVRVFLKVSGCLKHVKRF